MLGKSQSSPTDEDILKLVQKKFTLRLDLIRQRIECAMLTPENIYQETNSEIEIDTATTNVLLAADEDVLLKSKVFGQPYFNTFFVITQVTLRRFCSLCN